uniref:Calsequestrin n=1 Tax=Solanum tuberosum TaxID=4113 RepID=M1CRV3_SOLTU
METFPTSNVAVQTMICSLLLPTAQKSLLSLLFMVNSQPFLLMSFLVQVMKNWNFFSWIVLLKLFPIHISSVFVSKLECTYALPLPWK